MRRRRRGYMYEETRFIMFSPIHSPLRSVPFYSILPIVSLRIYCACFQSDINAPAIARRMRCICLYARITEPGTGDYRPLIKIRVAHAHSALAREQNCSFTCSFQLRDFTMPQFLCRNPQRKDDTCARNALTLAFTNPYLLSRRTKI